jgi:hypothetical protein
MRQALFPLTVVPALFPFMVMAFDITGSSDTSVMVPVAVILRMSLSTASVIACLSDPMPLSFVFVTLIVAA